MGFSSRLLPSIEAFAADLGVSALMAGDGSFSFSFARTGNLSLVPSDDGARMLVCLAWAPAYPESRRELLLLETAGPDDMLEALLHAGKASDGTLTLTYDLAEDQVSPQVLDLALRRLIELRETLR